ncbi:MAG TPA: APC family permease [Polyangia bacterium]|nr:APC family permease [Polyangia bacterium]
MPEGAEHRPLTLPHALALVVSSMIGTGVFTTAGFMLRALPSPALVLGAWALSGVLALAGAAVYAELGAMMPRAGGEYVYLRRAFPPVVAFLSGWVALLVGFAAPTAATAMAFARYLHALAPALPEKAVALALVAGVTALHARTVRGGGALQAALTTGVVAVVVVLVGAAIASPNVDARRLSGSGSTSSTIGAFAVCLIYASYSYFGWNAAAYVAGELRDPRRTLPRALLGGAAGVTILYVALNAVFLAAAPAARLSGEVEVGTIAATALFGARGGAIMAALVALALAGSASALAMTGPRVLQAMADDGVFFASLGRTNARGAPARAVILQGALAAVAVVTAAFDPLLVYAGFTLGVSAAATVAAAFVLRRRVPEAERPHRALAWPWSGVAFLALSAFMIGFAFVERPRESVGGLATLAGGAAVWRVWRRARRRADPST